MNQRTDCVMTQRFAAGVKVNKIQRTPKPDNDHRDEIQHIPHHEDAFRHLIKMIHEAEVADEPHHCFTPPRKPVHHEIHNPRIANQRQRQTHRHRHNETNHLAAGARTHRRGHRQASQRIKVTRHISRDDRTPVRLSKIKHREYNRHRQRQRNEPHRRRRLELRQNRVPG